MYCSSCGTQNPDNSKFCSNCGAPLSSPSKTTVSYSEDPPQYMTEVGWITDVPTEKRSGKIFHGFRFWFVLLDNSRKPTLAKGKILVRLSKWINTIYFGDAWSIVWEKTMQLEKSDYKKVDGLRSFPNGVAGFIQNIEQGIINDKDTWHARIEIWFTTSDGRTLYGTSR